MTEIQNNLNNNAEIFTAVDACSLTSKEQAQRYQQLKGNLFKKVSCVEELADGFELTFKEPIEFSNQLIEFVNFERTCCPSFTFSLHFEPNGGPIHLQIKGSKGIKDIIAFGLKENNLINN